MYHWGRAAAHNGVLRPGAYDSIWKNNALPHLGFTVGSGWSWNGRTLSKGNAMVSFYVPPVLVYADPCHWDQPQHPIVPPDEASGDLILSELAVQPMRYATRRGEGLPVDLTAIRLSVPSNLDFSSCDQGQYRTWGTGANTLVARGPGQRDLIWVSALGWGRELIVDAATFPSTPARLVSQVDAILASVGACAACG
jgi:hypothetical protein